MALLILPSDFISGNSEFSHAFATGEFSINTEFAITSSQSSVFDRQLSILYRSLQL